MAASVAMQIPSSLSQPNPVEFAISSITLHNAAASPALRLSVHPTTNLFVARSYTRDRIEYVQDTEPLHTPSTDTEASTTSAATTSAATTSAATVALMLKVHIDEGSRLTFGLKGHILESIVSVPQPHMDTQDHVDDTKENTIKDSVVEQQQPNQSLASHVTQGLQTTTQQSDVTLAVTMTTVDESAGVKGNSTLSRENSLGPDGHVGAWSSKTSLVTCGTESSSHSVSLFFVEVNSETELQEICQGSDFDRQIKERNIAAVDVQQGSQDQGIDQQSFTWTWEHPSRDRVEDDQSGRKAVFAFLHRNPLSGDIEIFSQFSLWIVGSNSMDQAAGLRRPAHRLSPSAAHKGHWRRASTPERFGSSFGRPPSYAGKSSSNLSNTSSPRLADAAGNTPTGTSTDVPGLNSGSSSNLHNTLVDTEDGPLFRATVVECENHIREMKASTKRIIKAAQSVLEARKDLVDADDAFVKELEGFKPAEPLVNNYLRPMLQSLAHSSDALDFQMRSLLIEPLTKFYTNDIKTAEAKRKSFDEESKEYYQYLARYMAIKHESSRKKGEADAKYDRKRKQFEKERFEYWGFLLDMRVGGSKSDEILHHLTNYSEKHCKNMMELALLAEDLRPSLDVITADLMESHRKAAVIRRERQERKKELEAQDEGSPLGPYASAMPKNGNSLAAASSPPFSGTDAPLEYDTTNATQLPFDDHSESVIDHKPTSGSSPTSYSTNGSNNSLPKFCGIRDLEHQDIDANSALGQRKEGFLFATSRPSMHNNIVVLEKPNLNWHKYWCVVSDGYLHEYSHWKKGVTMLHNEPINLKISAVRPCRNQDRRFCFEVITPKYRRVYQATSTEDMNSWVSVISNAIQSLLDGTSTYQNMEPYSSGKDSTSGNGRSSMEQQSNPMPMDRLAGGATNGFSELLAAQESADTDHLGTRLLKVLREAHPANNFCAECGAKNPDWCAINMGILICIECSGIHRSLGTHISKVRSFTLDTTSYTRDLFDFIRAVGNDVSNRIWEATLGSEHTERVAFRKPLMNDKREYKVSFIQKKYVERAFVNRQKFSEGTDGAVELAFLVTKALFQAASTNSIPEVIEAFAAGADLNAVQETEAENEGSDSNGDLDSQPEQQVLPLQQEILSPPTAEPYGSSFMVMQTSPLLVALHHGMPFSLDDQYEVYPMAEFMIQNGATSNLSVEVRLIEEDSEGTGQASMEGLSISQQSSHHLSVDGDWDPTQVDTEDIRNHHIRSNRRSLGEVVHMRGEGGATAMEYLRAKSAARGEPMPGSSPTPGGYVDYPAFSGSPPTFSPRYTSMSTPLHSPSLVGYSSTVVRQHSASSHHGISTLFQKRRESDGGQGSSQSAGSSKGIEGDKKSGSFKLQNAAMMPSSPPSHQHLFLGHSHSSMGNRAHKVKATLSKSLRLSAAYIKNNMLKEEKEYSVPIITQTIFSTSPPSSTTKLADMTGNGHGSSNDAMLSNGADMSLPDLSGPYILLHRKGSITAPCPAQSASS